MNIDKRKRICPDCGDAAEAGIERRDFLKGLGVAAAAAITGGIPLFAEPRVFAAPTPKSTAETAVKALYDSLTSDQRKEVCFDWDYKHPKKGLLRTHVSNNWHIVGDAKKLTIASDFFTMPQKHLIRDIYTGVFNPEWVAKFDKQLKDDTTGKPWGSEQNVALFGKPGDGKFEFVMTGRHMTIRADGNTEDHVALGGPIFHGHAASGFNEKVHHPGNIFWHQAELANKVYTMLDGKQQKLAMVEKLPDESEVNFRGPQGEKPGIPCSELKSDQKEALTKVLKSLIEPYRKEDQEEVMACLKKLGGLDKCNLAFYRDGDIGEDGEWDNWRLEGPAFVWYFRGSPHVHIWINVAADPSVALNSEG
jgi:hypothetical protein